MSALLPSDDLAPCPMCASRRIDAAGVQVMCENCGVGTSVEKTLADAIAAWNRRTAPVGDGFQQRVQPWMLACFGEEISRDVAERNHRFLEEALELVQARGCTASEAHQLVDYVFNRPVGEPNQEAGGVMVTLAALCLAAGLDVHEAGETELARVWTKVEKIRAKQAAKPKHSPLPQHVEASTARPSREDVARVIREHIFWGVDETSAAILSLLGQTGDGGERV